MVQKISGIYIIINTKNGKVYIGQAQDIRKRWMHHKSELNRNCHMNLHLQAAWNKYGGDSFKFQKLEYCSTEQLNEREQHYIDIYMPKGMCYNKAKDVVAPMRGIIASAETRNKISRIHKGKPKSEAHRLKVIEANKGRIVTDEARANMSAAQKRSVRPPCSQETKRKISEANKGRKPAPMSAETRRKLSEANKGRKISPLSEEQKQKLRELRLGTTLSVEHKRKISEGGKGRIVTAETRRKIGEANRGRVTSEETRLKIKEARKNQIISEESNQKRRETMKRVAALKKAQHQGDQSE